MNSELVIPEIFSAEDFWVDYSEYPRATEVMINTMRERIAGIANARFKQWALGLERLYATKPTNSHNAWHDFTTSAVNTHVALLAFPQEIKKAECEHRPSLVITVSGCDAFNNCLKCGAKLVAKWSAE